MTVKELLQVACCNVTIVNGSNRITVDAENSDIVYYLNDSLLNDTVRVIKIDETAVEPTILIRTSL